MSVKSKITESLGLVEKQKNVFYGNYKGYEVTLHVSQIIDLFVNFYADESAKLKAAQVYVAAGKKNAGNTETSLFGIHSVVTGATFTGALKKLVEKLDALVKHLQENGIPGVGYCMSCGATDVELKTIRLNDLYVTLDEECMNKLNAYVEQADKDFAALPNNYGKGFIGALLGAFIGCIAWIIVFELGYVSAIVAVLAVYLGNFFWVKFGGKPNNVKTVVVAVVSLLALVLTCLGVYVLAAQTIILEEGLNMKPMELILGDEEIKEVFIYNMIMNAIFTFLGVAAQYATTKKKDKAGRMRISK